MFDRVDILEQCVKYVDEARLFVNSERVEHYFAQGLQDFEPEPGRYTCIWVQWVLSHLTDEDLISFLVRMQAGLAPGGLIVVKENMKKNGFMLHKDDFSVTRSEGMFRTAFAAAGLEVLREEYQRHFPQDLFKVKFFALRPRVV